MSEWISVKDRTPDEYGAYLIVIEGEVKAAYYTRFLFNDIWNAEEWGLNIYNTEKVTHWMPLPEPPKEE